MSTCDSAYTPIFPLSQVFQGAQGPKGDKGDDGSSNATSVTFNSTDAKRAVEAIEETGSPAYKFLLYHAKPEAWIAAKMGGGAAATPTSASLPSGMSALSYRRRFIHQEIDTTVTPSVTKYYGQLSLKGVVELPASTDFGEWVEAFTLPPEATPRERINVVVAQVDSGTQVNVDIDTDGKVQVWLLSSPVSTIHLDFSQLRYEVEYI